MNMEQVKSAVRWVVATFGGALAGYFAAKGWLTADQVLSILNSETFIGIAVSLVGLVWGLFTHAKTNAVAAVDAMPEGADLAHAVPSSTVVPASTTAAIDVAKTRDGP